MYRIVVRVYADIAALDGSVAGSLCSFAANFSSVDVFFDFVNVLDQGVVHGKISETFSAVLRDRDCKHIFLAAWRRPTYLSMLLQTPDRKVTLVEGYGMGAGFEFLPASCPIVAFPDIFQGASYLELAMPTSLSICSDDVWTPTIAHLMHRKKVCAPTHCSCHEFPHLRIPTVDATTQAHTLRLPGYLPTKPPQPNHIPLNKHNERLDIAIRHPKDAHYLEYANRFPRSAPQPCYWHHLLANCHDGTACAHDHGAMSHKALFFLRYKARLIPCADGTQCRRFECCFGHVCQNSKCLGREVRACSMRVFHRVDPVLARWVEGEVVDGRR
ncbi:hypothetical protein P153DRAFT_218469 [Dothidotthia symphoricarpi CBS 119687]|uniref:C3H1-type domain-containing protein n=1 Tax=Dothidotthia symphoricarpi CBS 119687 TaxID=1392245 RepID=A0A6A6AFX2_9PLEO|nr:uncharacterized protein P153DRAFT_218469 [Dothidotthia symphoricarpi CBS 119687]KAF2130466.1 hypothetical protein P153DRAFT_218469 [Dothidotthia symphoricarpi CBS 119687]